MDAKHLQPVISDILEAVRDVRVHDEDVAGAGRKPCAVDVELGPSRPDDPGFGIGVDMKVRPLAGVVVDDEEGSRSAIVVALEPYRAALPLGRSSLLSK